MLKNRTIILLFAFVLVLTYTQITDAETEFDLIKSKVAVRLYSAEYWDPDRLIQRMDFDDIMSTLVLDMPDYVMGVSPEDITSWGKEIDELFLLGVENVAANYSPAVFAHRLSEDQELFVVTGGGVFTTTFIYKLDLFEEYLGKYGSLISIPHREAILILPFNSKEALGFADVFINVTIGMYMEGPGSTSHYIWFYKNTGFQRVDIVTPDNQVLMLLPEDIFE